MLGFFFLHRDAYSGEVRVYPDKLQVSDALCTVTVTESSTIADLIKEAIVRFGLESNNCENYRCSEILLDRGGKTIPCFLKAPALFSKPVTSLLENLFAFQDSRYSM